MSELTLRLLLYITIFLTVVLGVEAAFLYVRDVRGARRRINQRLQMLDSGLSRSEVMVRLRRDRTATNLGPLTPLARRLDVTLAQAGIAMPASRFLLLMATAFAVLLALQLTVAAVLAKAITSGGALLMVVFALAIGVGLPLVIVGRKRDARIKKLTQQFPIALDVFVRGLRAGHPVASALELLTNEMEDPIGSEFGIVVDEVTYGLDLRDALQNMADRLGIPDMHMFVVSVSIQNETGGNLAEILENLTHVIRARASLFMKVRALSSEGRMTGVMLTVLPVLAFCGTFLLSPGFYLDVADDPVFMPAAVAIITLYFIGVFMIRRMIDLKV